tara:strand:+ start:1239 stop:4328 length:3090 start_codon:yes stop_codon:yes gene_type:complete
MITLTPIHKRIQKRLFEKMDILGRKKSTAPNQSAKDGGSLNHAKMSTRSTFLRMTSGQLNPVILMGGKLKDDGSIPGGYDDIYGSRTYTVGGKPASFESDFYDDFDNYEYEPGEKGKPKTLGNKLRRPTPGVKGIDVTFKGGVRALREATINWTCWDWDELDLLMPHFLAHGKTVMVEWGWVYDKDSLKNLPDFLVRDEAGNRVLSADVYKNYRSTITDADGDFDMMVGIIKNFEFTTRDDGGFDCTTILSSVGASITDTPQPNDVALDPNLTYNLSIKDDSRELAEKISKATGKPGTESDTDKNPLIDLNTSLSLKFFIKEIDLYILSSLAKSNDAKEHKVPNRGKVRQGGAAWVPNKFLAGFRGVNKKPLSVIREEYEKNNFKSVRGESSWATALGNSRNYWVRWGWFEDNVLSKFLSVTSDNSDNPIITEFRSIERKLDKNSDDAPKYESTRIKNNIELQTTNINHYILPGQFITQKPKQFEINGKKEKLEGDSPYLIGLSDITTDVNNFSRFSAGTEITEKVEITNEYSATETSINEKGIETNLIRKEKTVQQPTSKEGFLRNMLINTKIIKQAFGVDSSDDFTVESVNVVEAIETMFSLLNQELNYWSYSIVVDEVETNRAKIIDEQVTRFDFDTKTSDQRSFIEGGEVKSINSGEEGVFFFPVWQSDSIVKRQNISAKVPDAMQLSIMYGSNMDPLKEFSNPGSQFSDKEGVLVGGLFNSTNDAHKSGLDIAFRNKTTRKIGVKHGLVEKDGPTPSGTPLASKMIDDASIPLGTDTGDDIELFLTTNSKELEEKLEQRLKNINEQLKISEQTQEAFFEDYNDQVPPPFASRLSDKELQQLLQFEKEREFFGFNKGELTKLFQTVYNEDGEMKQQFKNSVSYLTTQHGINKQIDTPLLIPLELELEIDGIGGIYPGNSFHSTYVPTRYQKNTVFQIFDVNHRLDSSTWTVTLTGKMRATMNGVIDGYKTLRQLQGNQITNYLNLAKNNETKKIQKSAETNKEALQAGQEILENRRRFGGGGRDV